ncbi:MAG: twin-arginine translocation signal domain-containing protein [Gemmatimonadales bacterium]|nr:MAG: twin-arginine translocation signal domain-containing protein [Gemmatimonadales bacterium]
MSEPWLPPHAPPRLFTRRDFLRVGAMGGALAAFLPEHVLADPYAPWRVPLGPGHPVRVRGRVHVGGRGLGGVAVTDGLRIVQTGADGAFELATNSRRQFVYMTLPRGHRIPVSETGTARFYQVLPDDGREEFDAEFALEALPEGDEHHVALVLADIQTQDAGEMARFHAETVPDLEDTIRGLGGAHAFSIACGDIMFDDLSLFPDFERAVARVGIPSFQVVGNHDLDFDGATEESSTRTFRRRYGPRYYSFDRGAVHYVVLDDVFWHSAGYVGYLDADQLTWLEADLARVEPGTPVVISLHIPVEGTRALREGQARPTLGGSVANRDFLYRLVEPFRTHFLAGHTHDGEHVFRQGTHGHVLGTVCGAWWAGNLAGDGTPNGYGVYEARGEEIRWRYKSTGQDASHQMRGYARGAVPEAAGEVAVNAWDWDPSWEVTLWQNGMRRGPMSSRVAIDPLVAESFVPDRLPPRRQWVRAYPTEHMLFAPVEPDATGLTVEARDRFGRVHSARIPDPA